MHDIKGAYLLCFFTEFFGGNFFGDYFDGTESRELKIFGKFVQKVDRAWTSKIDHRCQKIVLHI